MANSFSAAPQALGYLYQVRYALYAILKSKEEAKLSIESLDDVAFEEKGNPRELLQLKHHIKKASLTDSSREIWKTLRVWSESVTQGTINVHEVILSLVTTAFAREDSIAALLRPNGNRDPDKACQKLVEIAESSKNQNLEKSFQAFLHLTPEQRKSLINVVQVFDGSENILDVTNRIKASIRYSVRPEHLDSLYERLVPFQYGFD